MLSPRIETERLVLRRYKESDIDTVYEMITDKRGSKFLKFPNITKEEMLEIINSKEAKFSNEWVCSNFEC